MDHRGSGWLRHGRSPSAGRADKDNFTKPKMPTLRVTSIVGRLGAVPTLSDLQPAARGSRITKQLCALRETSENERADDSGQALDETISAAGRTEPAGGG